MWCIHWQSLLEKKGIPTVSIVDSAFEHDAQAAADNEGMPVIRRVIIPHQILEENVKAKTKAALNDIINALTKPLTQNEKKTGFIKPKEPPRIAVTGTLSQVQEYFQKSRWTDGLPIIPPTEENVRQMLKGTSHSPGEIVVEKFLPEPWKVIVEKVAINGVMAGCKPEHMPILLAMAEAFSKGVFESNVRSTTSFSFMTVVNGPIAVKAGMNSGMNALGPCNPANASIGRAHRLFIINLGGSWPGVNDMSSIGNPTKYSFAFAENEERSPWEPFHLEQGFKKEESALTIFLGGWYLTSPGSVGQQFAGYLKGKGLEGALYNICHDLQHVPCPWGAVVILDPTSAKNLSKGGFSKKDVKKFLWENTTMTAKEFRSTWGYETFLAPAIRKGTTIYREKNIWPESYLTVSDDTIVRTYTHPDAISILVVGGESNDFYQVWRMSQPISVSIDRWK